MTLDRWLIWPDQAFLSLLVLLLIALPFLWAARSPMHRALRGLMRLVSNQLRVASRWLLKVAELARQRNREVLVHQAGEELGGVLERELERTEAVVQRELRHFPEVQRRLLELLADLEEDYQKSMAPPPEPPAWSEALSSVSSLEGPGDRRVQRILKDIKASMTKMHDEAMEEYRKGQRERHKALSGSVPLWRSVDKSLRRVSERTRALEGKAAAVDTQMERYEKLRAGDAAVERALSASALAQFAIATVVLAVAAGGAMINFHLIALPMSEMVGAAAYLGEFRVADVAALVIILVEASLGLFLMELLGVTRLFSRIQELDARLARRLFWLTLTFLVGLATVEAALAFLRHQIAESNLALRQTLTEGGGAVAQGAEAATWIPMAGQMALGFILPFALAFVAIPLEVFIRSGRTVLGSAVALLLGTVAFALRLGALLFRQLEEVLVGLYDALISVPLVIERAARARSGGGHGEEPPSGRAGRPSRSREAGGAGRSGRGKRGGGSKERPAGAPAVAEEGA